MAPTLKNRMVGFEIVQPDPGPEERKNLDSRIEAIGMRIWKFAGSLEPVNRELVGFKCKMKDSPAEGTQLDASPGRAFENGDEFLPDARLELRRGDVPGRNSGNRRHQ